MKKVRGDSGACRLYVAEIKGEPLAYAVTVSNGGGHIRGERRLYIDRGEESRLDLATMCPGIDGTVVKIEGINGSGIVAALIRR